VPLLAIVLGLSVVGSLGGLLIASFLLLFREGARVRFVPWLISYAVGTLLGVAFLALLPQTLEHLEPLKAFGTLLVGIVGFFLLEKLVLWRHCHTEACEVHEVHGRSAASLVLIGGALHNFADGAVIGAAVLTSVPLGLSTALAVAAHQVPQEVGDFAILLNAGYTRAHALLLNMLTSAGGLAGAVAVYLAAGPLPNALPYVLAFAAGSFLYVAMSDLIPDLHRGPINAGSLRQILLMGAGILTIVAL
jgi:zinc and cadmium transporter